MTSTKTKSAIFLVLATILNICGYLLTFSFRINLLHFPVARVFSHHKSKMSVINEESANKTILLKRVLEGRFHSKGKLRHEETFTIKKESEKTEKLRKHYFDAYRYISLVADKKGNLGAEKNALVKDDKEKKTGPEKQNGDGILTAEKKDTEQEKKTDFSAGVKNKENQERGHPEKDDSEWAKENIRDTAEKSSRRGAFSEAGPFESEEWRPVNPHDFNYLINERNKCKNKDGSDKNVFLLVLIFSVNLNLERRDAVRRTWGSPTNIDGHEIITLFLLAKTNNDKLPKKILEENEQYHDIVMEDFVDSYKNLTLKTIMGMKWMSTFCAQAKFMMKTDDDMYVSYANIIKYLDKSAKTNFVTGHVARGGPIRDPSSKWYVSKTTYKPSKYPPYCSGGGYILSGDVPPKICTTSLFTPFIYIEDVYVGICMYKLEIYPHHHPEFSYKRTEYNLCKFRRIFTAHEVTPKEMIRYWKDQTANKTEC